MKTIAVIFTVIALAAPVCAHAKAKAGNTGVALKGAAIAAQVTDCQPDGQDPEPYIVHG